MSRHLTTPGPIARSSEPRSLRSSARQALRHATTSSFFALLVVGLMMRVAFVFSAGHHMDSDSAIVYLMAKHVAQGEFAAFFWGQSYGGTLLQLTAGIAMRGFGTTIEVMAITSILFWAAAAVFLRLIVQRSVGRAAGDVAGVLFWFPSAVLFSYSTVGDGGFYGPTLVLGLAAIWLVLRWPWSRGWAPWLALGILLGLSLWTSPMALAMATPAAVVAAARDRNYRNWILGGSAAIVAALPWLIETATSSLSTVRPNSGPNLNSFASMFTDMLPAAFPLSDHELVRFIVAITSVFALVALLYFGWRGRNLGAILVGLSSVLLIVVLVLGSGSGARLAADSVRYSSFLLPGLTFAAAWWATRFNWALWVIMAVAPLVTLGLVAQESEFFTFSTEARFDPALMRVAGHLESKGISAAYGDYWLAYAMSAATDEKLTVAALVPRRYLGYEEAAAGSSLMSIVVFADRENDALLQTRLGLPQFTRSVIGGYAIYEFAEWFDPFTLPLNLN
jgi:hypothetical protein